MTFYWHVKLESLFIKLLLAVLGPWGANTTPKAQSVSPNAKEIFSALLDSIDT